MPSPSAAPQGETREDSNLDAARHLDALACLEDAAARQAFFDQHPRLQSEATLKVLCADVVRSVSVDLQRSERLAETSLWLARRLGDQRSLGRALRARANALHSAGDSPAAQQQYEAALAVFDELGDALEGAITRSSGLLNLAYLGHYDDVERWEHSARATFTELGDRLRLANLANNVGNIRYRQDRWDLALDSYLTAFHEFLALGRSENAAICLRNIAVCYISLHRFDEALHVYAEARASSMELGLPRIGLQVDYNIAYLYYLRGEYTRAIGLFQEARRRSAGEGDDYHRSLCDLDQSEIYLELNLVEEAADMARSAYQGFEALKLPYEMGKASTFQAIAKSRLGNGRRALELLDEARRIFRLEGNDLWLALIDFYEAVVLHRQQRFDEAIHKARLAHRAFAASDLAFRAVMCNLLLARLQLQLGDLEAARLACQAALGRLDDITSPAFEHQAYFLLGQVEEQSQDRHAALQAYRQSHRRLERLRSQLHGEDLKIAFLKDKQGVYESLVWLTLQDAPSARRNAVAFEYIEKAKSRGLAELLSFQAHALPAKATTRNDLVDDVRRLREELSWLYRQLDHQPLGAQRDLGIAGPLRDDIQQKENDLLRALREVQNADLEYSTLQVGGIVDPQLALRSVPPDATLLEYFIARGQIFVVVGHLGQLHIEPIATMSRVRQLQRHLQFQLQQAQPGAPASRRRGRFAEQATGRYLQQLYQELIAPIAQRLQTEHLVVVPHGLLHHIPFHALMDADQRPLIEHFSISYAPSTSVFHLCANKVYSHHDASLVLAVADERAPHILQEAEAVTESLQDAILLVGEDATEDALRQRGASARYVHLATHGFFRRDNPMFSAIQLGTSRLSLFDLYDLRLQAELVVLSGCGTGLNAVLGTDELVGLTRGLLYAGAKSTLVTLWDVHDASAATFMGHFYRNLAQGSRPAQALRLTIREQRREHAHPYHWAPFLLVGNASSPFNDATSTPSPSIESGLS